MINCPVCDAVIDAEEDELDEGDELTCEECGAGIEVVGTDPLEIEAVGDAEEEEEEEDEDLDEDEDEDAVEEEEGDEDWR